MENKEKQILDIIVSFIETQKQVCELTRNAMPDYTSGMEQAYYNIENIIKVNLEKGDE